VVPTYLAFSQTMRNTETFAHVIQDLLLAAHHHPLVHLAAPVRLTIHPVLHPVIPLLVTAHPALHPHLAKRHVMKLFTHFQLINQLDIPFSLL
jgi:hypothetical protein